MNEIHSLFFISLVAVSAPLLARLPPLTGIPEVALELVFGILITTMPLVIAVTFLGVRSGDMLPENAHAIVGAAVITVTVFPVLALLLRAKGEGRTPESVVAAAVYRAADLLSARFSRLTGFAAEKASWKGEP